MHAQASLMHLKKWLCIFKCLPIHEHTRVYVCVYIHVHVCVYVVSVYICVWCVCMGYGVCVFVCLCVKCVCSYMELQGPDAHTTHGTAGAHKGRRACAYTHASYLLHKSRHALYTHTHAHTHTHTTHTHTHTHTNTHTRQSLSMLCIHLFLNAHARHLLHGSKHPLSPMHASSCL